MAARYIEAVANITEALRLVKNEGLKKAGIFYKRDDNTLGVRNPTTGVISYTPIGANGGTQELRTRVALADINAGITLLAAIPGIKYQLYDAFAISIGGAATTGTTVDLLATQSAGSVKLVSWAQASLTQSTLLRAGASGASILADGASFVPDDVNTAITLGKTGSNFTVMTAIDIVLTYGLVTA